MKNLSAVGLFSCFDIHDSNLITYLRSYLEIPMFFIYLSRCHTVTYAGTMLLLGPGYTHVSIFSSTFCLVILLSQHSVEIPYLVLQGGWVEGIVKSEANTRFQYYLDLYSVLEQFSEVSSVFFWRIPVLITGML